VVMDALPARRRSGLLFRERVGSTGRRVRKIMVVALARKLLIALWRFFIDGVLPEGAVLKPAA
jgi:transposase